MSSMMAKEVCDLVWEAYEKDDRPARGVDIDLTISAGYQVQRGLIMRMEAKGERLAGWKIGANSEAARQIYGADTTPFRGFLLESGLFPNGHVFVKDRMPNHVVVECELMFTIRNRLEGRHVKRDEVKEAISSVAPAIEIPTGRTDGISLGLMIADNMHHWGYVAGNPVSPYPQALDLGEIEVIARVDGKISQRGRVGDHIDNQLDSLAWLARQLSDHGLALEPGHKVMTGACLRPATVTRCEHWDVSFSGLGEVSVTFG